MWFRRLTGVQLLSKSARTRRPSLGLGIVELILVHLLRGPSGKPERFTRSEPLGPDIRELMERHLPMVRQLPVEEGSWRQAIPLTRREAAEAWKPSAPPLLNRMLSLAPQSNTAVGPQG